VTPEEELSIILMTNLPKWAKLFPEIKEICIVFLILSVWKWIILAFRRAGTDMFVGK